MTRMVIALYDDFNSANETVHDLIDSNITREDISYVANDVNGDYARSLGLNRTVDVNRMSGQEADTSSAGLGAGIGAAVGGVAGILVGLGALIVPGLGPVVAAGPLATALAGLAGAGAGALAGGVLGSLMDMGVPESTAGHYAEGIRRGGTLIAVKVDDHLSDRVVEIMNRHHPVNLQERVTQWRQSGWTGYNPSETGEEQARMSRQDEQQIPDTGFGQASGGMTGNMPGTYGVGRDVTESAQGTYGVGRDVYGTETDRMRTGQKRSDREIRGEAPTPAQSTHEIDAGGDTFGGEGSIGEDIGRNAPINAPLGAGQDYGDYHLYDARFQNHFQATPASHDFVYQEYAPAYHYGYDLAHNQSYHSRQWTDIEPEARRDWETQHPGTWDQFKEAVRHAWEDVKDALE